MGNCGQNAAELIAARANADNPPGGLTTREQKWTKGSREIRASKRRFYQRITDILADCSPDYDPQVELVQMFYKIAQSELKWAITGKTAAELIPARANADNPPGGLTTWKKAPDGKIVKTDVVVAKIYLIESERKELNQVVAKTILKYNYRITKVIESRAEKLCYLNGILFN